MSPIKSNACVHEYIFTHSVRVIVWVETVMEVVYLLYKVSIIYNV